MDEKVETIMINDKRPIVLIVDDMAANITILANLLREEYRIKIAKEGAKALEICRSDEKPDLILLDVEMPGMDGYEVCKELKNDPATNNIPIIFVTAKNDAIDEAYGLNLGAVDYIAKPFHPTIVKIRVKNHVALKRKSDLLEELSMYDGLTHIPNRRYFDETYAKAFQECKRENIPMALLMIDVDHFKPYNDHYGHGQGDACLIKVAQSLNAALKRGGDFVARYGGEEFVVLLRNIDPSGSEAIAEKLLQAVRDLWILHEYSSASDYVTISIGVSYCDLWSDITPEGLLQRADAALYVAKESGRNRFVNSSKETQG
jgi:diguanylate cyclase (GGDEF)-like protein